uniref:Superoxide dismutase [Cu-Zn] n=1 Tax=Protohermes xanthodes TaxID=1452977 RepID=A0AB74UEE2_9NEOP
MFRYLITLALLAAACAEEYKAIVHLVGTAQSVTGNVTFTQEEAGKPVHVDGIVVGLAPGKHGFHVHAKGDLTGGCLTTSGHFNPENKKHGAPDDKERHVGDLGNIVANHDGIARFSLDDSIISLCGSHNILGRAVVVHASEDDLGKGGHEDSLTTGHAGARVACGVIGILSPEDRWLSSASSRLSTSWGGIPLLLLAFTLVLKYVTQRI